MTGSPLNSLYHSVHSVYAPALLRNEAGRQELSGKVQVHNLPNREESLCYLGIGDHAVAR